MPETRVPMTLRDHFLQDPFFSSSWSDMDKVREHFSQQAQTMSKRFEDNWSKNESSETSNFKTESGKETNSSMVPSDDSIMSRNWMLPRKWMMPKLFDDDFSSLLDMKDSNLIGLKNDDSKMEISLNTAGYKPSELKVNVADGEMSIEGKHEEKSEEGHTMVSRQFSKRYTLPAEAKLTEVVSNLSQDGVMVITVPKEKRIEEVKENQKMKDEHKTSVGTKENGKSSESLVPLTMRDSFFDDPFFKDTWLDIESSQKNFFEKSRKRVEDSMKSMESSMIGSKIFDTKQSSMLTNDWSMPKICAQEPDSIFNSKDSNLIRMVNNDSKLEISLDTTGYKPDELKVSAGQGVMFDDNFSSLLDMNDSNLISLKNDDSKMEISLNTAGYKPSELKVNVADGEISIEGKHDEKSEEGHTMVSRQFSKRYTLPAEAKLTEVVSNLSQDGVMVITVPKEKRIGEVKENQKMKVEYKASVGSGENGKSSESLVPLTMRDCFFDDPFFKDTWLDIESSQKNFMEKSRKRFEESMKSMESSMIRSNTFDPKQSSMLSNDWSMAKICAQDSDSIFNSKDSNLIRMVNDDSKMEISLDTTGYKPDELKVSAGQGVICVEGKHEEKSEAGQVMVARQFSRKYNLPAGARAEEVVSNLSQDGVLVISVPKKEAVQQENRSVPIAVK